VSNYPPVAELVPHEAPMLALDELVSAEPGRATARLTLTDSKLFVREGRLDTVVTLEYMAQTVAACLGHEALAEGGAVRVGMVVACRTMTIHRPELLVGEVLLFEVERVRGTSDVSLFTGLTRDGGGEVVAEVSMTLVHGERPEG
jgi:predicted hotdog family 3-hydroxylacyl-ACP dehydratase